MSQSFYTEISYPKRKLNTALISKYIYNVSNLHYCTLKWLNIFCTCKLNSFTFRIWKSVISTDYSRKDGNIWFLTVPWNLYLINNVEDMVVFSSYNNSVDSYMLSCKKNYKYKHNSCLIADKTFKFDIPILTWGVT